MKKLDETDYVLAKEAAELALRHGQEERAAARGSTLSEAQTARRLTELFAYQLLLRGGADLRGRRLTEAENALREHWPDDWHRDEDQTFKQLAVIAQREHVHSKAKRG